MFGTNTMVCDPNSIKAQIINVIDLSTVCFLEGCCLITGGRINYSVELSSQSRGVALEDQFSVLLLNLEGWHWRISFFIISSIWRMNFCFVGLWWIMVQCVAWPCRFFLVQICCSGWMVFLEMV